MLMILGVVVAVTVMMLVVGVTVGGDGDDGSGGCSRVDIIVVEDWCCK